MKILQGLVVMAEVIGVEMTVDDVLSGTPDIPLLSLGELLSSATEPCVDPNSQQVWLHISIFSSVSPEVKQFIALWHSPVQLR